MICQNTNCGIVLATGTTACWLCGDKIREHLSDDELGVVGMLNAELEALGKPERHTEERWPKYGLREHRKAHLAAYRAARAPLVDDVTRLKAELEKADAQVDDYQRLHQADAEQVAYLEHELNHIRETATLAVKAAEKRAPRSELESEIKVLRAKLKAAELAAKVLDERLHSSRIEASTAWAEVERRRLSQHDHSSNIT